MNIQIFGKSKCFDTKKAQRYFKERRVKFQDIDVARYGMSQGELRSVKSAVGGLKPLLDEKSREYEELHIAYLERMEDIEQALLENPGLFKTPPLSATAKRRRWAISPMCGRSGNKMDERKVQRINELTRISRERELTEEEQQERQALRMEYVESVKKNLAAQLNSTVVVDEKGHRRPLRPKK